MATLEQHSEFKAFLDKARADGWSLQDLAEVIYEECSWEQIDVIRMEINQNDDD